MYCLKKEIENISDNISLYLAQKKIELKGNIAISGATGLIGKWFLLSVSKMNSVNNIFCLVRDINKAKESFSEFSIDLKKITLIEWNLLDSSINIPSDATVDYFLHAAGPTDSSYFVEHCVETINSIYQGCYNTLQFCTKNNVKSYLFLSTLEVYGLINNCNVTEKTLGCLDSCYVRNSYPEAKRLCECLVMSYNKEFDLNTKICRLTQTIGLGISKFDKRLFSYLAKCAALGEDIKLQTSGSTKRPYISVADAVIALITVLHSGADGSVFNVSDKKSYMSVAELSKRIANSYGLNLYLNYGGDTTKYLPSFDFNLNTSNLEALGWNAVFGVETAFDNLVEYYKSINLS